MLRTPASSDECYTPAALIRALGKFDLDPACGPLCKTRTARHRIGPSIDGLRVEWRGRVWLNPPFSNARPFVERLAAHGNGIVLVFSRTDARWFQRAIQQAGAVFAIAGRVRFTRPSGAASNCPLACCLIPFGKRNLQAILRSRIPGVMLTVAPASPRPAATREAQSPHPRAKAPQKPNARDLTLSRKPTPEANPRSKHE